MIQLRILSSLFESMKEDLARRHKIAAERVGFLYVKTIGARPDLTLLAIEYVPVKDSEYLDDPYVGAKIGSSAIRSALQRSYTLHAGCFHIHMHEHRGATGFSGVDRESNERLTPSFAALVPEQAHGAIVLSLTSFYGTVMPSSSDKYYPIEKATVVGYPTEIMRSIRYET